MPAEERLAGPVQVHLVLTGEIEGARLRLVWHGIIARRGVFSNGHAGNGNGNGNGNGATPRNGAGRLPWQEHDLRGLSQSEARTWVNSFLETDASQGISAERTPPMRFALAQMDEDLCELVWSFHPSLQERLNVEGVIQEFAAQCRDRVAVERISDAMRNVVGPNGAAAYRQSPNLTTDPVIESLPGTASAADDIEQTLTKVWESVLNVSGINPDDDFFDRGGHSLLAARLLARVEDAIGVELPLASLLAAPTIRGQAQLIRQHLEKPNGDFSQQEVAEAANEQASSDTGFIGSGSAPNGSGEVPNQAIGERLNRRIGQSADAVAIEDEIEATLISVWESVLQVSPIRPDDDFFDLGGHSVLATRLLMRIEDTLGVELALASLLEASTVRGQARLIRAQREKEAGEPQPVEQRPREQQIVRQLPFFFLGGDPTFRPLAQRLSELRPLHNLGLQASTISKLKDPYSMKCIADHFVGAIRERRPEGPYALGGWCAHGLLAYEIAAQLREQGREVALVVMLESAHPVKRQQYRGWRRTVGRAQFKMHLLKFEYAYLRQLNGRQARDYIAGRAAQKSTRIKDSFRRALKMTGPTNNGRGAYGNPLDVLYEAAWRYCPRPYDGKVVLVRCQQRAQGFSQLPDLGWRGLLGENLEICESPGNHYTLYMHPNVDALALNMNACLRRAEERAAEGPGSTASR